MGNNQTTILTFDFRITCLTEHFQYVPYRYYLESDMIFLCKYVIYDTNGRTSYSIYDLYIFTSTVFIPISAQGAQINHFGWALICFNIVGRINPKMDCLGRFPSHIEVGL